VDTARRDGPSLLDPSFLRELEALRRKLTTRARSGAAGERLGKRRGSSAEFLEHRTYEHGDDPRSIDWAAYARSGEPIVKLYRAEEDVIARIVCDASASLDWGAPSKLTVAKRFAAAAAYLALAESERAQLFVAGDGLAASSAPARGKGGLAGLVRAIDRVRAGGATDLARAVDAVIARSDRPGVLVVISDFLDSGPVPAALGRAALAGHDVALVHVVAPDEVEPDLDGDLELEDAETSARVELTADARAIEAYLARFAGLCASLRGVARRHGGGYVRARTDEPLEGAVRRFVARSVD
jgi:uncharacterized protein (DUF58 family)